jgi:hypothetical protein
LNIVTILLVQLLQPNFQHTTMMNCISSIPGRYNPRIFDTQDNDDDSVQEFYRAHPCILEKKKAHQMESFLENAITMAESSNGSLFCLQQMSKMKAIELGRHISTCQSMKEYKEFEMEKDLTIDERASLPSFRSFQSAPSSPTFLKVEPGISDILTQKSMDTVSLADAESEEDESEMQPNSKTSPAVVTTPPRSWSKLRKTLSKEERTAKQLQRTQSKRGSGCESKARMNVLSRKKSDSIQNFSKNSAREVSLMTEKKKGWRSPLWRNKTKDSGESKTANSALRSPEQEVLPLTPAFIPIEKSKESGAEDCFLNDQSPISDVAITVEDRVLYKDPVTVEESMEVVSQGSCFDIIGASKILNGLETSWKELSEDSFDVVPRRT